MFFFFLGGAFSSQRTDSKQCSITRNGLDVQLYYWDDRDGASFCGWWFGPKVGGDQVWAYHPSSSATTPPKTGWKVGKNEEKWVGKLPRCAKVGNHLSFKHMPRFAELKSLIAIGLRIYKNFPYEAQVPRGERSFYIEWCIVWPSCNQHIVKAVRCPSNHLFMSTWQVPYDGPVDSSFLISATSGQSAVPALPAPAETQPLGVFHGARWCMGLGQVSFRHLYCLNPLNLGSFNPIMSSPMTVICSTPCEPWGTARTSTASNIHRSNPSSRSSRRWCSNSSSAHWAWPNPVLVLGA